MTVADGNGSGAGDEVLGLGGRRGPVSRWWPPPPGAVVLGATALLAGLAAGYAAGVQHAAEPAAPPSPSPAAAPAAPFSAGGFPLSQSGPRCSGQARRELQVGLQITNLSSAAVRLSRVEVVLPPGGLRVASQAWGPCGQLPVTGAVPGSMLSPIPDGGQLLVYGHLPGAGQVPASAAGAVHARLRPAGPADGNPAARLP
jgi:hypothetical protein